MKVQKETEKILPRLSSEILDIRPCSSGPKLSDVPGPSLWFCAGSQIFRRGRVDGRGHEIVRRGFGLVRINVWRLDMGHRFQSGYGGASWGMPAVYVAAGGADIATYVILFSAETPETPGIKVDNFHFDYAIFGFFW